MTQPNPETSQKPTVNLLRLFAMFILIPVLLILLRPNGGHIEDTNGPEDSTLAVITMEQVCSGNWNSTALLSHESRSGQRSDVYYHNRVYEEWDYDWVTYSAKKVSGIQIIHATYWISDTVTLEMDTTLKGGNLELMIFIDGEYHCHVPVNEVTTLRLENVSEKLITLVMAAESADMKVKIRRDW